MGDAPKFGRRSFLGGALVAGAAAGLGVPSARAGAASADPTGMAPSGARGLGPGGSLLPPGDAPPSPPAGRHGHDARRSSTSSCS